jgi:hypothetical protein
MINTNLMLSPSTESSGQTEEDLSVSTSYLDAWSNPSTNNHFYCEATWQLDDLQADVFLGVRFTIWSSFFFHN